MQVLYTILFILLFVLCLSILIMIHELGHFLAAKFFKVYVKEFSIGFGPAFFQRKRKNGETTFSLRSIPFGGYVAMYEKGMELEPGLDIPESRSFQGIAKWKRIIILFAGVFNNAVLAVILFFISETCFVHQAMYLSYVSVAEASIAETSGIKETDYIALRQYSYIDEQGNTVISNYYYVLDKDVIVTYQDDSTSNAFAMVSTEKASYKDRSYDTNMFFFEKNNAGNANLGKPITGSDTNIKDITFTVTTGKRVYKQYINNAWEEIPSSKPTSPVTGVAYINKDEKKMYQWDGSNWVNATIDQIGYEIPSSPKAYFIWGDTEGVLTGHTITLVPEVKEGGDRAFQSTGLSYFYEEYWTNFGDSVKSTFVDFGNAATLIVRSFASLFTTPETWKQVGGIVAIGVQTSNILQNFGLGRFIYVWALISVNLAIVNLFPFPGLDGWQILVLVVEALFHREIPDKVKNILSLIGIAILMTFMVLILVKDVIGLF